MLKKPLSLLKINRATSFTLLRNFHHEFLQPESDESNREKQHNKVKLSPEKVRPSHKVFRDEESTEIFDVVEERLRSTLEEQKQQIDVFDDIYAGLSLQRGVNGVFDIEDLVDVLRKETADDIFVCSVPKDINYVDYIVVCSGRSYRHMLAIANFVRRMFKIKRAKSDVMPKIEGETSRDWMAMDLGNIALHVYNPKAREEYDLESLWAIGSEYDRETNKPKDPLVELFERHTLSTS